VNNVAHGFQRLPDGTFTMIDAPGAGTGVGQGTCAAGNNSAGAVAGWYVDANNVAHGFLRTP
jgi:molybdopterin/thiamine biosynthesis adenylyltransferase